MPALATQILEWSKHQEIFWYPHLVIPLETTPFSPLIFDYSVFEKAFDQTLELLPGDTWDSHHTKEQILGLAKLIKENASSDATKQQELIKVLNEVDRRRSTSWVQTFPWLDKEITHVV